MARNQTFSVSLNLLTKNFQNGVKTIQSSLNNLKMQFRNFAAALGAGIGIGEVMSNMIDSAKKLDKAQTVLRNVSDDIEGYGQNQRFVMEISKKYNQELTTLMNNYAKFHSAASNAGMALEDQQYIYESLTRAAAFFNLTADETNSTMFAVQQMMSKGKIQSEEFIRQFAERIPGALAIAADAYGVTSGDMLKMIQSGNLMATDLLPKLAKELNNVTRNIDVDTLQGALNRVENSFTNLTSKLNIGKTYKNILNGVSGGLDYIADNLRKVKQSIAIAIGTLAGKPMIQKITTTWTDFFSNLESSVEKSKKKLDRLRESAMIHSTKHGIKIDADTLQPLGPAPVDPKALKSYERLKFLADDYADTQKILAKQQDELNNKIGTMGKKFAVGLKNILKFVGVQAMYMAIAAAISAIVTKLVSWYTEQKRIKNLIEDTREELDKMANEIGGQEALLKINQSVYNDENATETERIAALKRINELLGLEGKAAFTLESANEDVNKAVEDRINLIKKEQEYQARLSKQIELQNKQKELENEKEKNLKEKEELREQLKTSPTQDVKMMRAAKMNSLDTRNKQIDAELGEIAKMLVENGEKLTELEEGVSERQAEIVKTGITGVGGGGELTGVTAEYKEIQDEYNKNLRTLNEQKKHQLLTEDEYNKELEKLVLKTAESILALNDIDENTDSFAKGIIDAAKAYVANAQKEDKVKDELDNYYKSVKALYNQYNNGVITHKKLEDELYNLLEETLLAVSAMGDLTGAAEKLAESFKKQKREKTIDAISNESAPQMGEFDTTLSYKKESSEMYQENADYIRDYASQLDTYIESLKEYKDELTGDDLDKLNDYIDELETNLDKLTTQADSFAQAAKFAEVQEDIKNMKKELAEGIWDNISGIATAAERLTNSFKSMKETMNDPDVSGWEKFITIFTTIISTIETIVSVIKTFNTALQIAEGLSMAMTAAEAAGIPVEIEKIALMTAEAQIAKQVAVAKHMSAAASVPYPANLAAIATTSAALAAAFAAIPAFANGGIIQGSSTTGDKNIARVNAGEMILNKAQQATLFSAIASGNLGGSGNVSFEIRGDKLVGVLNNYQKKISK